MQFEHRRVGHVLNGKVLGLSLNDTSRDRLVPRSTGLFLQVNTNAAYNGEVESSLL